MKKIALAIMVIVISFSSIAQTNNSKSSKHKEFHQGKNHFKRGENLEKLNLRDDQKSQIKTLNETFRQQMQDLNKNKSISTDEQKEKRKELVKEHKEKISSILTPEQRKQAQDESREYAAHKHGKMHGKRFGGMTKDLNLTPEQSTKMKDLNAALRNNIQSIRQNTSLSKEEKKEQMKSLMKKHKNDMEDLLTNEQKEQLKNHPKNRRNEAV